jgi:uncharacterized protein
LWADLRDAGLLAHRELSTWDKPAQPCLASRMRYGLTIMPARLDRVEHAEVAVRAWLAAVGTPSRPLSLAAAETSPRTAMSSNQCRKSTR